MKKKQPPQPPPVPRRSYVTEEQKKKQYLAFCKDDLSLLIEEPVDRSPRSPRVSPRPADASPRPSEPLSRVSPRPAEASPRSPALSKGASSSPRTSHRPAPPPPPPSASASVAAKAGGTKSPNPKNHRLSDLIEDLEEEMKQLDEIL
jgi:flagellar protein FliO/FliZ